MKFRDLIQLVRFHFRYLLLALILWIIASLIPLLSGLIPRSIFNSLTGEAEVSFEPGTLIWLLLLAELMAQVALFVWLYFHVTYEFGIEILVQTNVFKWIVGKLDISKNPISPGRAISHFRDDSAEYIYTVNEWYRLIGDGVFAILAFIIMIRINPSVTIVAFLPLTGIMLGMHLLGTRVQRYRKAKRNAAEHVTKFTGEIFRASQAVKVSSAEATVLNQFRRLNDTSHKAALKDAVLGAVVDSYYVQLTSLTVGLVLILSAQPMAEGRFTVGDFALFVNYLQMMLFFPRRIGRVLVVNKLASVSYSRLAKLFNGTSPETITKHTPIYLRKPLPEIPFIPKRDEHRLQTLTVEGLTYRYSNSASGIKNINLNIKKNSFTVITGRIGAGKSTLLRVLLGLQDKDAGEIRWNGELVEHPASFFVPPRAAYTAQVLYLFSESLKDNVLLGLPEDKVDLEKAIYSAVMEQDVAELSNGLDTIVGPSGVKLSGGQAQRSAAARMFVREPEIFFLDDLSSALDVDTERALWQRFFAREATTCLVVSHRRMVLQKADHVIVMKDGEIEGEGTLDELLETSEEMQRIWQGDWYEENTAEDTVELADVN